MNAGRNIASPTDGRDASALIDTALRIAHAIWIAAVLVVGLLTLITVLAKRSAYGAPVHEQAPAAVSAETSTDLARAVALAGELESRWRETLDVEPLLDDYFARDIVDRMRDERSAGDLSDVDAVERRRDLVTALNVAYLGREERHEGRTYRAAEVIADADSGYWRFGISEGSRVYEVCLGQLWLTFAETEDGLRVVAVGLDED